MQVGGLGGLTGVEEDGEVSLLMGKMEIEISDGESRASGVGPRLGRERPVGGFVGRGRCLRYSFRES